MISKILDPLLNIIRFHKKKLAVLALLYLVFLYFIFPFNDLGDLVAAKVSQLTQGQVFVDFEKLDISLFPQPGLELSNINVGTAFTSDLSAKSLTISPSLTGLMTFKPGVSIRAEDLFGGDVDLSTRGGDKTSSGTRKQKIDLDLSDVSVAALSKFIDLPLKMDGDLSGDLEAQVDPEFGDQPSADLNLQVSKATVPEGNLITPFGPFSVPRINIADISLETHGEKGTWEVTKFNFGKSGSDLSGNVTGRMDLKVQRMGAGVNTVLGGYDFSVHVQVSDNFRQKFGPYLSFLSGYQNGNSYAFRIYGTNAMSPPNLTRIQ